MIQLMFLARLRKKFASATETDIATIFGNYQKAVSLRHALEDMGYPQPAIPVQVVNQCSLGIMNETITQRKLKVIDIHTPLLGEKQKTG